VNRLDQIRQGRRRRDQPGSTLRGENREYGRVGRRVHGAPDGAGSATGPRARSCSRRVRAAWASTPATMRLARVTRGAAARPTRLRWALARGSSAGTQSPPTSMLTALRSISGRPGKLSSREERSTVRSFGSRQERYERPRMAKRARPAPPWGNGPQLNPESVNRSGATYRNSNPRRRVGGQKRTPATGSGYPGRTRPGGRVSPLLIVVEHPLEILDRAVRLAPGVANPGRSPLALLAPVGRSVTRRPRASERTRRPACRPNC
jgi:hypothetical protein